MLTAAKLTIIPDPAEVLAERVISRLNGDSPPNTRMGGALADWAYSKVRWFAMPNLSAAVLLHAAALVAARYERS